MVLIEQSPQTRPAGARLAWAGHLKSTHYWDCNGQGCDSLVLQPWDETRSVGFDGLVADLQQHVTLVEANRRAVLAAYADA